MPQFGKPCPLTPTQERQWGETKTKLVWSAPAFAHLFYKMMNPDQNDTVLYFTKEGWDGVPGRIATDGKRIIAEPDYFFGLTLGERVFACCHEIGHSMFQHLALAHRHLRGELPVLFGGKSLPYNQLLANMAQDYVINAMLVEANLGTMIKGGLHDPNIATSETSWQEAYHKLAQNMPKPKKGQGQGQGSGSQGDDDGQGQPQQAPGQFDVHLPPGTSSGQDPNSSEAQPDPQQWQQAIIGAATVARAQGKLPASLEKMFDELLKPKVTWTDHIQALFARHVGGSSYDFRRLDRRLITRNIGAPGKAGKGAGTIVVGMDTSGLIYAVPSLIERFFAELSGILEDLRPRKIVVVWCDAQVQHVDEIEDAMDLMRVYQQPIKGGGGTSFKPVFKQVAEMGLEDIDALVYLTDGEGSFPSRAPADYPVIWGHIGHESTTYPWGLRLDIPVDGGSDA